MKRFLRSLFFLFSFGSLLHNYAVAQAESESPGQKLLRMAEAKQIITSDAKLVSLHFNELQQERVSLWDKRVSLLARRDGLSPIERVTNSTMNVGIETLTLRIKDLDIKIRRHFVMAKASGVDQPYIDKCIAKILREGNDIFQPFVNGNFSGKATLNFYVLPTGEIRKLKVSSSTGRGVLNDALVDAVVISSPCDRFSQEMSDSLGFLSITVPFEFGRKQRP